MLELRVFLFSPRCLISPEFLPSEISKPTSLIRREFQFFSVSLNSSSSRQFITPLAFVFQRVAEARRPGVIPNCRRRVGVATSHWLELRIGCDSQRFSNPWKFPLPTIRTLEPRFGGRNLNSSSACFDSVPPASLISHLSSCSNVWLRLAALEFFQIAGGVSA